MGIVPRWALVGSKGLAGVESGSTSRARSEAVSLALGAKNRQAGKRQIAVPKPRIAPPDQVCRCRSGLAGAGTGPIIFASIDESCGCSSVGRASRCQRDCRGFESHQPLSLDPLICDPGGTTPCHQQRVFVTTRWDRTFSRPATISLDAAKRRGYSFQHLSFRRRVSGSAVRFTTVGIG